MTTHFKNRFSANISSTQTDISETEKDNATSILVIPPSQQSFNSASLKTVNRSDSSSIVTKGFKKENTSPPSNNPSGGGMSKFKFNSELETLKQAYEEEKKQRIKMEELATKLLESVNELKKEVSQLKSTNNELLRRLNQI